MAMMARPLPNLASAFVLDALHEWVAVPVSCADTLPGKHVGGQPGSEPATDRLDRGEEGVLYGSDGRLVLCDYQQIQVAPWLSFSACVASEQDHRHDAALQLCLIEQAAKLVTEVRKPICFRLDQRQNRSREVVLASSPGVPLRFCVFVPLVYPPGCHLTKECHCRGDAVSLHLLARRPILPSRAVSRYLIHPKAINPNLRWKIGG
jgi:hypothetical protein